MATRKPTRGKNGKSGGGGLKSGVLAGISLLMVAGFVIGWAQANNIRGLDGALEYFRTWSKQVQDCGIGELQWDCETPVPGYEGKDAPKTTVAGEDVAPNAALAMLENITIAPSQEVDYDRSEWKHWSDLDGNGCDTREDLLIKSGENVKTDPDTCKVLSGTWVEPYANTEVTNSSKMDIDHVAALSWTAANGGQKLSAEKKQQLANDPQNLYISIAGENRSKGDKGISEYLPPNKSFQCQYVTSFITVVDKYDLTMPKADANAARKVLETQC